MSFGLPKMTTKTQFTTELWNSFPEGKKPSVITTNGSDVRILCTDSGMKDYPIVGMITLDTPYLETWTTEGSRVACGYPMNADLHLLIPTFPPPPEGHQWHNPANVWPEDVPEGMRPTIVGEMLNSKCMAFASAGILNGKYEGMVIVKSSLNSYFVPLSTPFPDGSILQEDGSYKKPDPYAELKAAHAAGKVIQHHATKGFWVDSANPSFEAPAELYRIKPETKLIPLGPEDVPPGSVVRFGAKAHWIMVVVVSDDAIGLLSTDNTGILKFSFETLMQIADIKRPNDTDWLPCSKGVEA